MYGKINVVGDFTQYFEKYIIKKQMSANGTKIGTENKQSNVSLRSCFAEYKCVGEQIRKLFL